MEKAVVNPKDMAQSLYFKTAEEFSKCVSHQTFLKMSEYINLVLHWNKSMNLIAKSTEQDIWFRHALDSAQLIKHIFPSATVLDIGSGAGFPGIIIALMQENKVILVEKDMRKCSFLHQVRAKTGANLEIKNSRIEETELLNVDTITCRAFASLSKILELGCKFISNKTTLVLLKGESYIKEVEEAKLLGWNFEIAVEKSITNKKAGVLILTNIHKNS